MYSCRRRVPAIDRYHAGARAQQQMRVASCCEPRHEAQHRLVRLSRQQRDREHRQTMVQTVPAKSVRGDYSNWVRWCANCCGGLV